MIKLIANVAYFLFVISLSSDGLVGYDITLTRLGPRVQVPL